MSILKFAKKYVQGDQATEKTQDGKKKEVKKVSKKLTKADKQSVVSNVDISLLPIVTEKGVRQQEDGFVVFRTYSSVTKGQVKEAVQNRYKTNVLTIKSMTVAPKVRRRGATVGKTVGWKKFYVKVSDINKIVTGP